MASLQRKGNAYYCQFFWKGSRRTITLGPVSESRAQARGEEVDNLLEQLERGQQHLPEGVDIADFIRVGGNVKELQKNAETKETSAILTVEELRNRYLEAQKDAQEENSLATVRMHFRHFERSLGVRFDVRRLDTKCLQDHINRRKNGKRKLSPVTLKKEMATLRAAWNWAMHTRMVAGAFPGRKGLVYPKGEEKPAYMTMAEIERRVAAGEDPKRLWESLYLTLPEIAELLDYVKEHAAHPWIYPMFVFAAHTSARRSEILRVEVGDVDLANDTVLIKEKKRDRTKRTTRRVPLSALLKNVLTEYLPHHPGGRFLFCHGHEVVRSRKRTNGKAAPLDALTKDEAHDHLKRTLKGSMWGVLRGWHILRHAAISALVNRGVDQRVIDSVSGHLSETERRRYTHLYPDVQRDAVRTVFT